MCMKPQSSQVEDQCPSKGIRMVYSWESLCVNGVRTEKLLYPCNEYDFRENKLKEEGWPNSAYTVSKVGVSSLSIIQQKILDNETPNRNIKVNFVHPGWVKSDMNDKGNITTEEGAKPTLYVILDNNELKGKYIWWDCQVVDWFSPNTPPRPYPVEDQ
nr:unnamed protein product [Callosobruchus analis]